MKLDIAYVFITPGSQAEECLDTARLLAEALADFGFREGLTVERGPVVSGIWFLTLVGRAPLRSFQKFNGVHRMVRISPSDPKNRRHTSFVSVHVHTLKHSLDQIISYTAAPYKAVKDLKTGKVIDDELGMIERLSGAKRRGGRG